MTPEEFDADRKTWNTFLIILLRDILNKHPELRLGQVLADANLFNEEPRQTHNRLLRRWYGYDASR
jgi:hypothetical protein